MEKILIVEDEQQISSLLEKFLQRDGFATMTVSNGEAALQAAQIDKYSVILLNIRIPVKDGWTVLKELRELGNNTPVIVVTAYFISLQEVLERGANDYIEKPFMIRDLLAVVRRQLES